MVSVPRAIFNLEGEFRESEPPPCQTPLRLREVHYPPEGLVVCPDRKLDSLKVGPEMSYGPDDRPAPFLRSRVVTLGGGELSAMDFICVPWGYYE
jgi:hypothetical protein